MSKPTRTKLPRRKRRALLEQQLTRAVHEAAIELESGRAKEALELLNPDLIGPGCSAGSRGRTHLLRARALLDLDVVGGARTNLDAALSIFEVAGLLADLAEALLCLSRLHLREGNPVEAKKDLDRACALQHNDADVSGRTLLSRARVEMDEGSMDRAAATLQQVLDASGAGETTIAQALHLRLELARLRGDTATIKRYTVVAVENPPAPPSSVYRFFDTREYAQQFIRGRIRLSTLETCRNTEDPKRRDRGEGIHSHYISHVAGNLSDPHMRARLQGLPIYGDIRNLIVHDVRHTVTMEDAWILCLSLACTSELALKMGAHAVRIHDPTEFARRVTEVLIGVQPLRRARHGAVRYASRDTIDDEPRRGSLGFVKPDDFSIEREYRMLWRPAHDGFHVAPRFLDVPSICDLVSWATPSSDDDGSDAVLVKPRPGVQ